MRKRPFKLGSNGVIYLRHQMYLAPWLHDIISMLLQQHTFTKLISLEIPYSVDFFTFWNISSVHIDDYSVLFFLLSPFGGIIYVLNVVKFRCMTSWVLQEISLG